MKVKAGKGKMLSKTGDFAADIVLHRYRATKKLAKIKKSKSWKAAAAAAADRRLLIGNCGIFKPAR